MKTNRLRLLLQNGWLLLTEVPGWSDAPLSVRLRRTIPIALPCLGIVAVIIWNVAWHGPQIRAENASHASLLALEAEIESLQLSCSEQQAVELAERAGLATRLLLSSPAELSPFLNTLKSEAAGRGWTASFIPGEPANEAAGPGDHIFSQPVRVKLTPAPGHAEVYASLLALMEKLSNSGKRIELMRLAVRADEDRWQSVEANLRLAYPFSHEKNPQ